MGDLLRAAIFGDFEVVLGEAANDGSGFISDVDEDADQLDVETEGLVVLRSKAESEAE